MRRIPETTLEGIRGFIKNPVVENLYGLSSGCLQSDGDIGCSCCPYHGRLYGMVDYMCFPSSPSQGWWLQYNLAEVLLYMILIVAREETLDVRPEGV